MPQGVFVLNKIIDLKAAGADSGTVTVDLPTSNYLQGLNIRWQNTNGATSNTGDTIDEDITKIEVTADGVPVYSVTGEFARALAQFDIGELPPYIENQDAAAVQSAVFPIWFGRDYNDKEVILPAHRFATLQLKIEYAHTDSGTTGFATSETNAKYTVIGRYLVSPVLGNTPFLKKIETYSKSLSTAQEEDIDLPVGAGNGAYRRIFLRVYEAGIEDGTDVDKYELVVNDSQRIVNERWDTSQAEDHMRYGAVGDKCARIAVAAASGGTYNSKVSRIKSVTCCSMDADGANLVVCLDALAGDLISYDSEDTALLHVSTDIKADGVPFCTVIDLGTDNLNDCLDVGDGSGVSSLKVKLNVAATGATGKCVYEQLVLY